MMAAGNFLEVYLIAGTQDVVSGSLPTLLKKALKAGITCFQYREKGKGSLVEYEQRKEMALICRNLCRQYNVPFLINDDVALAVDVLADGVHVGQEDKNIQEVLAMFPNKIVGLSCYNQQEIDDGNKLTDISYYGIGPVFGTISKADAKPPIGVEKLRILAERSTKPAVAIGGITIENVKEIQAATVAGAAVISAVTRSNNIQKTVEKLKKGSGDK
ncbi:thiamine phosphate synthase [Enterococcus sp. LJL128]|uniref:thiamine phosphate synthase n=1 Tax=Enterococcus sp. LJL51 TaxID=3416656 RepID=UPI003CFB6788